MGKGPWSCEQRLGVVSSVRCGAPIVRTAWCCALRYLWALGTCSPLACVTLALLRPTCAPAPMLSVLALSWPTCDLRCARVWCVLWCPWCLSVHASVVIGWALADPLPVPVLLRHQAPEVWARCHELSTGGLARRFLSHRVDACIVPPALHAPSCELEVVCVPLLLGLLLVFVCLACP